MEGAVCLGVKVSPWLSEISLFFILFFSFHLFIVIRVRLVFCFVCFFLPLTSVREGGFWGQRWRISHS